MVSAAISLLGACGTPSARNFVPKELISDAEVANMSGVRAWGDEAPSLDQFKATQLPILKAKHASRVRQSTHLQSNLLALSGGGENGAFGAGLLAGWSERGDRPEFDVVTGVSAGALIAPFAFLGSTYDKQLSELFTKFDSNDIYQPQVVAGLLGGDSLASNEPLKALIATYVDDDMIRRIAEESAAGRVLLIGTTNLDAERPVFWDIGKIAARRNKAARELIQSILLASAALPGIFPPVRIRVVAGGKTYDELHIDGGPTRQVFFSPNEFSFKEVDKALGKRINRTLYVIRNGKLGPEWKHAGEGVLSIGQRSLYATTKYQALGDLARIHAKASADGIVFRLAAIPNDFDAQLPKPFDRSYMRALFSVGHRQGRGGYPWLEKPPGISVNHAQ